MQKTILSIFALATAITMNAAEPRSEISTEDAIATVKQGQVAGYSENGIYTYKGIPYAKAERFMPPQAPDAWEGVRSSRNYGPTCPQDKRQGWQNDEIAFVLTGTTVIPVKIAYVQMYGLRLKLPTVKNAL